jgi:hypothetical protein
VAGECAGPQLGPHDFCVGRLELQPRRLRVFARLPRPRPQPQPQPAPPPGVPRPPPGLPSAALARLLVLADVPALLTPGGQGRAGQGPSVRWRFTSRDDSTPQLRRMHRHSDPHQFHHSLEFRSSGGRAAHDSPGGHKIAMHPLIVYPPPARNCLRVCLSDHGSITIPTRQSGPILRSTLKAGR